MGPPEASFRGAPGGTEARTTSKSVGHPPNDLEKNINDFDRMTVDDDCSSGGSVDVRHIIVRRRTIDRMQGKCWI